VAHLPSDDLESSIHYLGMINDEALLARVEAHLVLCAKRLARAEDTAVSVDAPRSLRAASSDKRGPESV
jgi:hypothetical protein